MKLLKHARLAAVAGFVAALMGMAVPLAASAAPAQTPPDSYCRAHVWSQGSVSGCVTEIQHLFNYDKDDYNECGMASSYPDLAEDGKYGPKTKAAVVYLQQHCHISADGVVGPRPGTTSSPSTDTILWHI